MSEVRGDDALGGVPFNVSNPAFASGAGSTLTPPPVEAEPVEVEEVEVAEVDPEDFPDIKDAEDEAEPPESGDDGVGFLSSIVPDPDADQGQPFTPSEGFEAAKGAHPLLVEEGDSDGEPASEEETTTDVPDGEV